MLMSGQHTASVGNIRVINIYPYDIQIYIYIIIYIYMYVYIHSCAWKQFPQVPWEVLFHVYKII